MNAQYLSRRRGGLEGRLITVARFLVPDRRYSLLWHRVTHRPARLHRLARTLCQRRLYPCLGLRIWLQVAMHLASFAGGGGGEDRWSGRRNSSEEGRQSAKRRAWTPSSTSWTENTIMTECRQKSGHLQSMYFPVNCPFAFSLQLIKVTNCGQSAVD
jgi:hypothetical protein